MINLDPSLEATEFNQLSYKEKNAYIDEKLSHRINLTYNQALQACKTVINSNNILKDAFQNYETMKDKKFSNLPNTFILMGVFVDKIKEKIFFHLRQSLNNGLDNDHMYVFDITSNIILTYAQNYILTKDPNLPTDMSNITNIMSEFMAGGSIEQAWRTNKLSHWIFNPNAQNLNFSRDQEYVSDDHYKKISKTFTALEGIEEKNYFFRGAFMSSHNPAHVVIDPEDIMNHQINIKNARNA